MTTIPEGWKLVPVEPTEEMLNKAFVASDMTKAQMRKVYRAMLAASPAAPEPAQTPAPPQKDLLGSSGTAVDRDAGSQCPTTVAEPNSNGEKK